MKTDIIVDLQYGDCGKGKIAHHLLRTGNYTHCIRYNGGCNAGHTIYHEGKKMVTHHIPAGVFYNTKSIIGPGCVLNIEQFFKEMKELREAGLDFSDDLVKIAKNVHIITDKHMQKDGKDSTIGTTKRGNGPAYSEKYGREGIRAENIPELKPYLIDLYDELYSSPSNEILFEGAQGFGLDIDWGDYPYVTSSHCTAPSALLNGVSWQTINRVYGVAKPYETYVGLKDFEPKEDADLFEQIRQVGAEFGATTGRSRQINWMNLDLILKAVRMNGVTDLIFNKMDVMDEVGVYKIYTNDNLVILNTSNAFKEFVKNKLPSSVNIVYSYSPEKI